MPVTPIEGLRLTPRNCASYDAGRRVGAGRCRPRAYRNRGSWFQLQSLIAGLTSPGDSRVRAYNP